MSVAGLLLSDSRFPAGGHAHSGGVEPAVTGGLVTGLDTLEAFLRGRLQTAGLVAAAIAAAACAHARPDPQGTRYPGLPGGRSAGGERQGDGAPATHPGGPERAGGARDAEIGLVAGRENGGRGGSAASVLDHGFWSELDAEADARTPAPAQREASRRQGRALLRAARTAWPDAWWLAELATAATRRGPGPAGRPSGAGSAGEAPGAAATGRAGLPGAVAAQGAGPARADGTSAGRQEYRGGPHHAVVLGAAAAAAGCAPAEAARIAAYQAVAGPASAAVRLLALDPMRVTGVLAGLAADIDRVAAQGAGYAEGPPGDLPAASAPALDLLAETHIRAEVRLFES